MAKVIVTNADSEDEIELSSDEMEVEEQDTSSNKDDASRSTSKGLANVMAKILSSSVGGKKVPILANAVSDKKLAKRRKKKAVEDSSPLNKKIKKSDGTEEDVVSFECTSSKVKDAGDHYDDASLSVQDYRERILKKKRWEEMCHVPPPFSQAEIEKSRRLKRIATKGVVKLFNTVLEHQAMVNEKLKKLGTTESKREKVLSSVSKGEFIEKLKNKKKTGDDESIKVEIKEEPMEEQEQIWDVLRDDFMMKPDMKDWDKKENSDDDDDDAARFDSDSESD